ncbi:Mitochondrial ribosome-associated GTPase 1 [Intoshia linei]|uniref:Mitochondrial GTPase 1 n=1 Tax=Intoshia linei TaxID=1819745 RepID=A0A177BDV0_9BILA|nr:Mitochondrial ribosome-associated GTPase 1 [Intoshia linei]
MFRIPNSSILKYFPGHMAKGLRIIKNKVSSVDCIIEIRDARIPFSSHSSKLAQFTSKKPYVLILNKSDLISTKDMKNIEKRLKNNGLDNYIFTSCIDNHKKVVENIIDKTHKLGLVVGMPNVGKSTFINKLRQIKLKRKGRATPVGMFAGVTRRVMDRIKVCDNPSFYMLDTPGILSPSIDSIEAGMRIALCGTMQDHLVGNEIICEYLVYWMNKNKISNFTKYYQLDSIDGDIYEILKNIAIARNLFSQHKTVTKKIVSIPDYNLISNKIIRDFRSGNLGKICLDL